jgi:hypothetical protein
VENCDLYVAVAPGSGQITVLEVDTGVLEAAHDRLQFVVLACFSDDRQGTAFQKRSHLAGGNRAGEIISLRFVATLGLEESRLLGGFHAFGGHLEQQLVSDRDDGAYDRRIVRIEGQNIAVSALRSSVSASSPSRGKLAIPAEEVILNSRSSITNGCDMAAITRCMAR